MPRAVVSGHETLDHVPRHETQVLKLQNDSGVEERASAQLRTIPRARSAPNTSLR